MPRNKLRPINETRAEHGKFTSETAYRLMRRKAGLARARQMKADGYALLNAVRAKGHLVSRLKAQAIHRCNVCANFRDEVLAVLRKIVKPGDIPNLSDSERKLLS